MQKIDEKRKNLIFIEAMADAISDCEDLPVEDIRKELKADDLDLDVSVNSLMDFVRNCSMDAKRQSLDGAAEARKIVDLKNKNNFGEFLNYSKDQLLTSIKKLLASSGETASLAYRELDEKNQEDLANILEDFQAAKDLGNKKNIKE